jgi:cytochrome c
MLRRIAFAALTLSAVQAWAQDPASSPELKRGKLLFIQCRACHELKADQPHKVGPNLHGLMGRKAGTAEGFTYSPALAKSAITWDAAALDKWLEKPSGLVPGNMMAFAGIANPADRAAIIKYIEVETK